MPVDGHEPSVVLQFRDETSAVLQIFCDSIPALRSLLADAAREADRLEAKLNFNRENPPAEPAPF